MKRTIVRALVITVALAALLAVVGCTKQPGTAKAGTPSTVTYIMPSDPMVFWDPAETWAIELVALHNMYETLVRIDPTDNNKIIPVLATEWTTSPDKLKWTFKLRGGVKFHSGKPLTAEMAAASLNRTIKIGKGASYIWSGVKEIKAVDSLTLEFDLSRPLPMLFIVSSAYAAYIYDASHDRDWYYQPHADGTGPYTLKGYTKDSELILEKFKDYWGGWAKDVKRFDYAIIKVVPESATRRQLLSAGQADIIEQLPIEDVNALKADPKIAVSQVTSFQELYAFLNTQKPPLNKKEVRQALSYLMPYTDILDHVTMGAASQARGVIPPTLWGYGKDLLQYTYDVEKAKELLKKAGYPNGGLKLLYTYTAGDKNEQKVGELFKDALAKANIDLEIRGMTTDSKYNLAKAKNPRDRQDITMLYWWPDNLDPSGYLISQFHSEKNVGFNFGYYYNPVVDKLIDQGAEVSGVSIEEATQKFIDAQKIIVEDAPAIFIYCDDYVRPYRKTLLGYKDNPAYPNVVFFYDTHR
jgi:peptide/nickel transport system substrate-binding protein